MNLDSPKKNGDSKTACAWRFETHTTNCTHDQWNRASGFETTKSTSFLLKFINSPQTNMINGIMPRWKSNFLQKQKWSMSAKFCSATQAGRRPASFQFLNRSKAQTNHLAWHRNWVLHQKHAVSTHISAPSKMRSFKTQITWHGMDM